LFLHCGEAAYHACNASIRERLKTKLTLDTQILAGPSEVELKGAKLVDGDLPNFTCTFQTQQIICLYDNEGKVVEGKIDDIRLVYYVVVLRSTPRKNGKLAGTNSNFGIMWKNDKDSVFGKIWRRKSRFFSKSWRLFRSRTWRSWKINRRRLSSKSRKFFTKFSRFLSLSRV